MHRFRTCSCLNYYDADNTLVNVINDVHTASNPNGEIRYEFYQIPSQSLQTKMETHLQTPKQQRTTSPKKETSLESQTQNIPYRVTVNFRLDQTSTSIIMDNGAAFGVNTIKAVPHGDGAIHLNAIGAGVPSDSSEPDTPDRRTYMSRSMEWRIHWLVMFVMLLIGYSLLVL